MKQNPALSMIGLCQKAGKVKSGETAVEIEVKKGTARLLIVAEDVSERTKKTYADMAAHHHIAIRVFGTKETLGSMLGKASRAALVITDEKMAAAVVAKMDAAM